MEKEIYTLKVYNTLTKQYEDVVVTKKVYDTYHRTEWNIKDNDESFYEHEIQISGLIGGEDNGYENFREFVDEEDTPENIVMKKSLIGKLHQVIGELPDHEAALIRAIYFDGVTETDYAKQIGVSIAYVCKLNKKILRKIQKSFQWEVKKVLTSSPIQVRKGYNSFSPDHWQPHISFSRYIPVVAEVMSQQADESTTWPQDCSLWCAMTDNGDNDTSVAYCAVGGVPGDGEIPMETVRSCPSAESPMSGVLDKYGQHTKRQTK